MLQLQIHAHTHASWKSNPTLFRPLLRPASPLRPFGANVFLQTPTLFHEHPLFNSPRTSHLGICALAPLK
jgi:hypothetical protein